MINIKGTNLWAVKVPVDYCDFEVFNDTDRGNFIDYLRSENSASCGEIILPEGEWKLLGEAAKGNISFGVEPYVENLFTKEAWRDYRIPNDKGWGSYPLLTANESFYSLLSASGQYWVNPMGEFEDFDKVVFNHSKEQLAQWQHYQNYLLPETTKLLILNKI